MKKCVGKNRVATWLLFASVLVTFLSESGVQAQGPPNIVWTSGGHGDSVNSIVYSPDGQFFASGSSDKTIKLWRSNGLFLRSLSIPYNINAQLTDVQSVAISPD